jgi:hypothetical protein
MSCNGDFADLDHSQLGLDPPGQGISGSEASDWPTPLPIGVQLDSGGGTGAAGVDGSPLPLQLEIDMGQSWKAHPATMGKSDTVGVNRMV